MNARLLIETALRNGKTVLQHCFYTPPFKVLDITEDKQEAALHLMLMNSSPGILDGDAYSMKINVAAGCSLQLYTQSYQRLFQMKQGASQQLEICMKEESTFCYLPHPSVPHRASHFTSKTQINLSKNCTLIWGEIVTCGRNLNGEQFSFSKYHSLTEFFLNEHLVLKENLLLQPSLTNLTGMGQMEGYTHQASLVYLDEAASVKGLMETWHDELSVEENICFGITALPVNGVIVRLLGYKGEQLHGLLKKLARQLIHRTEAEKEPVKAAAYAN